MGKSLGDPGGMEPPGMVTPLKTPGGRDNVGDRRLVGTEASVAGVRSHQPRLQIGYAEAITAQLDHLHSSRPAPEPTGSSATPRADKLSSRTGIRPVPAT